MDTHIAEHDDDDEDEGAGDDTVYQDDEFDDLLIENEMPTNSTQINVRKPAILLPYKSLKFIYIFKLEPHNQRRKE